MSSVSETRSAILIVSKDAKEAAILQAQIEFGGFWGATCVAHDAQEALAQARRHSPVLLVYHQPDSDPDVELCRSLRSRRELPLVVIGRESDAKRAAASGFLPDCYAMPELHQLMRRLATPVDWPAPIDLEEVPATLADQARMYKDLFDRASDVIILIDFTTHRIVDVNKRSEQLYGYRRDEFIGMSLLQIIPREEHASVWQNTREIRDGEVRRVTGRTHIKKDGTRIAVTLSVSIVEYAGRKALQDIIRDETERIATEKALADAAVKLREAHRMISQEADELSAANARLQQEIVRRTQAERAQRQQLEAERAHVGELNEAQVKIARLSERLQRALAGSRLVLWELDLSSGMVELSPEWSKIVGGEDAVLEVSLRELRNRTHPDDRASLDEAFRSVLEGHAEQYDIEHRVRALDDTWKWVRSTGRVAEFDVAGRPLLASGTNRDITPRKLAELALRESEERYRTLVDASLQGVYVHTGGIIRFANAAAARIFGYASPAELIGQHYSALIPPHERTRLETNRTARLRGELVPAVVVSQRLRKDGSLIWTEVYASVVSWHGEPGVLVAHVDITQRKQAETALQENERKLRLVTDAVPAMIVYLDADLRYLFCNRLYRETMGRDEERILGRTVREVVGDEQYEVSRPWLEKALAGERVEYEFRHRRQDGRTMDLSVTYVPRVEDAGAVLGLYALLVDLTERKRAERIKEQFISMVSHELRTPLTSIIWTLALLKHQSAGMSKENAATVVVAQQNAERMLHLADEILEIEKIDQGELQLGSRIVALPELVARALALNQGLAQKHGVQLAAAHLAAAQIRADPDRLLQVLSNLISNAAKHSPRDGKVEIGIERRGVLFRISVRDSGRGVPEAFRDRLFGRFAQSSDGRALGGSGLGLAICKEIVERSGGTIGYHANPGGGSVFWFDLPTADGTMT